MKYIAEVNNCDYALTKGAVKSGAQGGAGGDRMLDLLKSIPSASRRKADALVPEMGESRAAISARAVALMVVAATVAAILITVLLIPFVDDLAGTNTGNLTGTQRTMVDLLPTVILLVPVLVLIFAAIDEAR